MVHIGNDWDKVLEGEFQQEYYQNLRKILVREYRSKRIFPPAEKIFNALKWTSYKDCKVVLLGQDPYHGLGQAHGLSFSVPKGQRIPPSLQNMYKELQNSLGLSIPHHGCLEKWAKQGVLLLNTSLTVVEGQASSHSKIGWEIFTDHVIQKLNEREEALIFILWGNHARSKKKWIDSRKHYILEGVHPSPLSANRGFFGCGHFRQVNEILRTLGKEEIDWQIEE
ncbi:uracil-DNA glycosylase [Fusobacterium gonidiaformans]|uniref:uracil-DNA glycosylase n=1 Tax=Fusobacterium gonidiaformans TaxID=849 RepID=UPI0001BC6790|nr:uracil-DNA glycosylase [Fusobacterium gonidiaformans]AVQ16311.1 uracil-DNA glycosylase [Fusobacterium gonidiaformans ATCC 25563]EFS28880.1 uracil-DNA glycosylase [Fusobacterium gonidiaformans ATCC 25563]